MAQPSSVERRVRLILDPTQRRRPPGALAVCAIMVSFASLATFIGGSALAQDEPGETGAPSADTAAARTGDDAPDKPAAAGGIANETPEQSLQRKLREISVPLVRFDDATLAEAIDYCVRSSQQHDPEGTGINIVTAARGVGDIKLSLALDHIPLGELLRYIALLSDLEMQVEPHSVVYRAPGEHLVTKVYAIPEAVIKRAIAVAREQQAPPRDDPFGSGNGGDPFSSGEEDPFSDDPPQSQNRRMATGWLSMAGVSFPGNGAAANYEPLSSRLIVRNTRSNIALVDALLASVEGKAATRTPPADPLRKRMRAMILTNLDFQDATIGEAVQYLRKQSGDPPINLLVVGKKRPPKADPDPFGADPPPHPPEPTITLRLRKIPLETALDYIAELAGYTITVDPHAVILWGDSKLANRLETRSYPIASPRLRARLGARADAARAWLEACGLTFYPDTSAFFEPLGGNLIVRHTVPNLALLESVLAASDTPRESGE